MGESDEWSNLAHQIVSALQAINELERSQKQVSRELDGVTRVWCEVPPVRVHRGDNPLEYQASLQTREQHQAAIEAIAMYVRGASSDLAVVRHVAASAAWKMRLAHEALKAVRPIIYAKMREEPPSDAVIGYARNTAEPGDIVEIDL